MVASTEWCKTAARPTLSTPWHMTTNVHYGALNIWSSLDGDGRGTGAWWCLTCDVRRQASQQQDASKEGRSWQPGWIDVLLMTLCGCVGVCVSGMGDKADSVCARLWGHINTSGCLCAFTGNASQFIERGREDGKQSRAIHHHSFLLRSLSFTVKTNKRLEGLTHFVEKKLFLFLFLFFPGSHSVYH